MDKQGKPEQPQQQQQQVVVAPDAASILLPALKFGSITGSAGLVVGSVAGVLRNAPAVFFAAASGIQWFGLGTTYWGTRNFLIRGWDTGNGVTPRERVSASATAGAVAGGGVGLLTRGPRNLLPGGIMFGLFGFAGQSLYNIFFDKSLPSASASSTDTDEQPQNFWQRVAAKKWTPFTVLTDAQYKDMLSEKLLRLDAEIALVDEKIEELTRVANEDGGAVEETRGREGGK
ncbi:hypothetical protein AAFC00_000044 [Neodothiora populina]|uniref:Uncharacterized protein n=1 Tax=Neodothiora populina TaxID=2781224 RepID=A0ABR3P1J9_9PEZI